jgi:hypothetical protein
MLKFLGNKNNRLAYFFLLASAIILAVQIVPHLISPPERNASGISTIANSPSKVQLHKGDK